VRERLVLARERGRGDLRDHESGVDPVELAHLQSTGNYGSSPSQSGKYFALTPGGAQAFASAPINAHSVVTSTTLPKSVVTQGFQFTDPGVYGAGPSVFFSQPQLPTVYGTMTPPVVLPKVRR
jgi:hypothetical protein